MDLAHKFKTIPYLATNKEIQLLLYGCQIQPSLIVVEKINQIINSGVDWNSLLKIATPNKVITLFYHNLISINKQIFPQTLNNNLKKYLSSNNIKNKILTQELIRLINLLKNQNIQAIPFKGPILAVSAYGNLALRQFTDIDILIKKKDILQARELLIKEGYKNKENLTEAQEIAQLESRYVKAYTYSSPNNGVEVEIHWKLRADYTFFPINYQQLWQEKTSICLENHHISSLSPEDEFLYLCVHGCGDRWKNLAQICDLAAYIFSHEKLNWTKLLAKAKQVNCQTRLLFSLALAQNLLGIELPSFMQEKIVKNSQISWLNKWAVKNLFSQSEKQDDGSFVDQAIFDLKLLDRFQDQVQYIIDRSILLTAKKYNLGFAKKYGLPGGK